MRPSWPMRLSRSEFRCQFGHSIRRFWRVEYVYAGCKYSEGVLWPKMYLHGKQMGMRRLSMSRRYVLLTWFRTKIWMRDGPDLSRQRNMESMDKQRMQIWALEGFMRSKLNYMPIWIIFQEKKLNFTSDKVLTMLKAVMIVNQRRNHSIDIPDSTFVKIRFQPEDAAEQNLIKIFQNLFNLTNGLFDLEKIELFVINATRNRF